MFHQATVIPLLSSPFASLMSVGDTVHLGQCVDQLSQQFDNCMAKVLADSQTQSEYGEHEGEGCQLIVVTTFIQHP